MNSDTIQGGWLEFKGKLREVWGDLTDSDLDRFQGQWHEIAHLPRIAQQECSGTIATYSREGTDRLVRELEATLEMTRRRDAGWAPPVQKTVAMRAEGVPELLAAIERHHAHLVSSGELSKRRLRLARERVREIVERTRQRAFWTPARTQRLDALADEVEARTLSPYAAAQRLLSS